MSYFSPFTSRLWKNRSPIPVPERPVPSEQQISELANIVKLADRLLKFKQSQDWVLIKKIITDLYNGTLAKEQIPGTKDEEIIRLKYQRDAYNALLQRIEEIIHNGQEAQKTLESLKEKGYARPD